MARVLLQDFIQACQELDRAAFRERLKVPVLICEAQKAGLSFDHGQTRIMQKEKEIPLARELIRKGHQLPVLELRQRLPGPPGQVRLGRSRENDLVVPDNTVSSRHAVFQLDEGTRTYALQDLASMNGSLVNRSRLIVGKAVVLFDGDVLAFGNSVFLFFYPEGLYDVLKANLNSL